MPISPTLKLRAKRNKVRITFDNGFGKRKERASTAVKKEIKKKEKKSPRKKTVKMYKIPGYMGGGTTKCKSLFIDPATGKCISSDSKIYKDNVARGKRRLIMAHRGFLMTGGLMGGLAGARFAYDKYNKGSHVLRKD